MLYFLFDKYRKKQFYIYVILVALFVSMFGMTLGCVSFEKEAQKVFKPVEALYAFLPANEYLCHEEYYKIRNRVAQTEGIYYDPGIRIDGIMYTQNIDYFMFMTEQFASYVNIQLCEGTGFTKNPNEVIVIKNSTGYKVGDTIEASYALDEDVTENMTLTVVGIMEYPVFVDEVMGSGIDVSDGKDFFYPYSSYIRDYKNYYEGNMLLLNPVNPLSKQIIPDEMCYIYVEKDNINTNGLLEGLKKIGVLKRMDALRGVNIGFWDRDESILEICLLITFVFGVLVYNYLDMRRRMHEYGLYFMFGATWKQTILLSMFHNLAAFFVGFLLGTLILYVAADRGMISNILFLWSNQLLILFGLVLSYVISLLPVYCRMRHTNPISLIRGYE